MPGATGVARRLPVRNAPSDGPALTLVLEALLVPLGAAGGLAAARCWFCSALLKPSSQPVLLPEPSAAVPIASTLSPLPAPVGVPDAPARAFLLPDRNSELKRETLGVLGPSRGESRPLWDVSLQLVDGDAGAVCVALCDSSTLLLRRALTRRCVGVAPTSGATLAPDADADADALPTCW